MKKTVQYLLVMISISILFPVSGNAAYSDMNNFCITPPFIQEVIKPNLLLMIDNSSSMYDLSFADEGNKSGTTITRQPYYCYDSSYKSLVCSNNSLQSCTAANVASVCGAGATCNSNTYVGYFDPALYYSYDLTNKYFTPTATFPNGAGCDKYLAGTLCVAFNVATSPNTVSTFVASGNYLNWLTSSKFDVEKKVLTGGKYDGTYLIPESRGCVGQGFVKDVMSADFVNYSDGGDDPNTQLGITFAIRGPIETANPAAPSQGGQTHIEIYRGSYNYANCQAAMQVWGDPNAKQTDVRDAVELCLNYNPKATNYCLAYPTDPKLTCTIDANCYGSLIPSQNGGCANNSSIVCTSDGTANDPACGTTVTPGACDNIARSCATSTDCTVTTAGTCSNQPAVSCSVAGDCTILGHLGTCSNRPAVSCSTAANCTFAEVKGTCSNSPSTQCTSDANCTITAVQGKCSIIHGSKYDDCSTDADCGTKYGTCSNPAPIPASSGTCQGYSAASSGSCNDFVADNTGTCSGGATTTGNCVGAVTVGYKCTNPYYQPAVTPYWGPCINPDQSAAVKTKVTYSHTIQTCWSYFKNGKFSNGDFSRLTNSCDDALAGWGICSADNSTLCTSDANCATSGLGTCQTGPSSIRPGNPALICGNSYVGQFCNWDASTKKCTDWSKGSATDAEKDAVFAAFCDGQQSTIIDPTDSAASTSNYEKTPAILSGIGVEAQLGQPIGTLPVKIQASAPTGLIQQFAGQIRVGAMSFNQFGSASEASSTAGSVIITPKVCSNNTSKICSLDVDCGAGTCSTVSSSQNLDGAKIIYPIGYGKCATMTAATCTVDGDCSSGTCLEGFCGTKNTTVCTTDINCTGANQKCISNGAGDHTTAGTLVNAIDSIRANAWTPFAEAYTDAIGYFARLNTGKSRTDLRINAINTTSTDFTSSAAAPVDYNEDLNPSQYKCQQNYTLLISDGASTADQKSSVSTLASLYSGASHANIAAGTCTNYLGSQNLPIMTWIAKNMKISNFAISGAATTKPADPAALDARDTITSYVVFNGGSNGQAGACDSYTLLSNAALKGGTTLKTASKPEELSSALKAVFEEVAAKSSSGTAASILSNSEGSGATLLQALFYPKQQFDKISSSDIDATSTKWIGELQSFWYFLDPFLQKMSIREDTNQDKKLTLKSDKVVKLYQDSSNMKTLVNKYSDLNGDGAADSTTPDSGEAGISPETVKSLWRAGKSLWERNLGNSPRIIYTGYNSTSGSTPQKFSTVDADGFITDSTAWSLLQIPAGTDTQRKALATKLVNYTMGADQVTDSAPCLTTDCSYRTRRVHISGCGLTDNYGKGCSLLPTKTCAADSDCTTATEGACVTLSTATPPSPLASTVYKCTREWKLGDIVASTPKIVSNVRNSLYNLDVPTGYNDSSYAKYVTSTGYQSRGMAFVGANDGMLHAFKLGTLTEISGANDRAQISNSTNIGKEEWAYIPKHTLPYLKYLAEKNYNHIFYVDKSPQIVDVSVGKPEKVCSNNENLACTDATVATDCGAGNSCVSPSAACTADYSECPKVTNGSTWRTILIGGTGLGGAGRPQGESHNTVKPPISAAGYSSYFALDVTDPANPKYLWEFFGDTSTTATSTPKLGFSTAGAAIVRVSKDPPSSSAKGNDKNGKWFAVFASGPLGPIDTNTHSFLGQSDQRLRLFVVDLASGALLRTIDLASAPTNLGLDNAFAGALSATTDTDRYNRNSAGFYSDDAVYIGYTKKDTSTNTWTKGGVIRLLTKESTNPADWTVSKVIDDIGPVTTAISKLQDRKNKKFWLLFGTGRFFYKGDDNTSTRQALYGVKEPCYSTADRTMQLAVSGGTYNDIDGNCTDSMSGSLVDQSGDSSAPAATLAATAPGWKILLDEASGRCANNSNITCTTATADSACGSGITCNPYLGERIITDPVAAPNGGVFFTSFRPSNDPCLTGGDTLIWAVRYDTGNTPPAKAMQGQALMQVSTGAFAEIKLSDAFKNAGNARYDGRRLAVPITGVPPTAQGLSLFTNPPPAKKFIHVREK